MKNTKITYPELYLSSKISSLLKETPTLPKEPILPQKPKEPLKPKDYDDSKRNYLLVVLAGIIIFFILTISADEMDFDGILLLIGLGVGFFLLFKIENMEKESHEKKKNEYTQAIKQYPFLLERYEKELAVYKENKRRYNITTAILLSKNYIEKYRKNKIIDYLAKSYERPIYIDCEESDIINKGISEDFFARALKESTSWNILQGKKVPVGTKFFYPDIIIDINGIYINVEIDEPYVGNDGTPIHYIEDNIFKTSIDNDRNDYMTQKGWIVIRFAEEQIFLHTNECIEYISKVIDTISKGKCDLEVSEQFVKEKWDKQQSYKMSYKRFRRTYIPQIYLSHIDEEDYRSYSDIRKDIFYQ